MLSINGPKSSKSSELIKENPSLVDIKILKMIHSIGMLGHKLIRKRPTINSVLQDKLKLMTLLPNLPNFKEKSAHKWKNKDCLSIKEPISSFSLTCISIVRCGKRGVTKPHYLYNV